MSSPLPMNGAKRMMKVLCPVEKEGTEKKTYWIRCGTAFWNRDQSINLYLDVLPRNGRLQVRELDEDDLKDRDPVNPRRRGSQLSSTPAANDEIPF